MPSDTIPALAYCGRAPVLAEEIVRGLAARKKMIAAAESCTAGLASDFITRVPGASNVFWGSFVSYTPDAKARMLGLPGELIERHGEVSRPVALAMAEGALEKSGASWAFSITGFAGPGGGSAAAPVGTIWIGIAGWEGKPLEGKLSDGKPLDGKPLGSVWADAKMFLFAGGRNEVREAAAAAALQELLERINRT